MKKVIFKFILFYLFIFYSSSIFALNINSTNEELAETYAPTLKFSSFSHINLKQDDSKYPYTDYIPINVESVFDVVKLRSKNDNTIISKNIKDQIGTKSLRNSTYLDFSSTIDAEIYKENANNIYALNMPAKAYKKNIAFTPTVYFKVHKDSRRYYPIAIQYWFFYFYNEWSFSHWGDWESVTLFLDKDAVFKEAVYSTHYEANRYSELEFNDGLHPNVYVSNGGHGSYAHGGSTNYSIYVDSHYGHEEILKYPYSDYKLVDLGKLEADPNSWFWFSGGWGDNSSAPQGPFFRTDVPSQWSSYLAKNPAKNEYCSPRIATNIYSDPWKWGAGYLLDNKTENNPCKEYIDSIIKHLSGREKLCMGDHSAIYSSYQDTLRKPSLHLQNVKINGSTQRFNLTLEQNASNTLQRSGKSTTKETPLSFSLTNIEAINVEDPDIPASVTYDALAETLNIFAVGLKSNPDEEPTKWYQAKLQREGSVFTLIPGTLAPQPLCAESNGEITATFNVSHFSNESGPIDMSLTKTDLDSSQGVIEEVKEVTYQNATPFSYTYSELGNGAYTVLVFTRASVISAEHIVISDDSLIANLSVDVNMGIYEQNHSFIKEDFNSNVIWEITKFSNEHYHRKVIFESSGTLTEVTSSSDPFFSHGDSWYFKSNGKLALEWSFMTVSNIKTHALESIDSEGCYIVNSSMSIASTTNKYKLCKTDE